MLRTYCISVFRRGMILAKLGGCTNGVTLVHYTLGHRLEYRRHPWDTRGTPFGFAIWLRSVEGTYGDGDVWGRYAAVERRYGKDTWLPAESGAHRAPAFITWATHRSQWEGHRKDVHNKQLRLLHNLRVLMGGGFSALRVIHVLLVMQRF